MEDITHGMIKVLKENGIEVTKELEEQFLVELRLAYKRLEGYRIDKKMKEISNEDLIDNLYKGAK